MSENRLAPGQTLRLKLLTGHLLNHLHVARPASTGCSACGLPWTAHTLTQIDRRCPCERCGAELDAACYYALLASADEVRRYELEDADLAAMAETMAGIIFLCRGCLN